jgi:hypothetical protein
MSLLQLKNIHKRHLLWAKLFGICLFIHSVFLFWVFCVYRDNSYMLSLSINKKMDYSTPIFFLPVSVQTTADKPINTSKKPITPKKTTTPAAPIKKTETKQKPTTVAAAPKKIEPVKQEIKKIEEVKKEVAKIEQKKTTPVVEQPKQTPVAKALDIESSFAKASEDTATIPVIPENAHISHNYREVEALRKQAQLQKEIVQTWKPPIGVSPDCMCEVSFFINSTGKIENIKIVKSSGVMMFDISVRQALFAMKMPQWTYGKPFTISFSQ